jgi:hypothetical protein
VQPRADQPSSDLTEVWSKIWIWWALKSTIAIELTATFDWNVHDNFNEWAHMLQTHWDSRFFIRCVCCLVWGFLVSCQQLRAHCMLPRNRDILRFFQNFKNNLKITLSVVG